MEPFEVELELEAALETAIPLEKIRATLEQYYLNVHELRELFEAAAIENPDSADYQSGAQRMTRREEQAADLLHRACE